MTRTNLKNDIPPPPAGGEKGRGSARASGHASSSHLSLGEGQGEGQRGTLEIREGSITPYLAKPQQPRHSREGGNPVREAWPLPQNWRWARMGDVAEVIGGSTPKTDREDYFGGDIPWITPADLSGYKEKTISRGRRNITQLGLDNSGARLMPAGSVLFSSRAPIGYVAVATNPVCTNQGFKSFILCDELLPDYVYYWLQVAKKFAVEMASGTTFLEISGKKVAEIPIPVPPLAEQRRIVAALETQLTRLDASVTALKHVQANLKRYRASVLKAACEGRLVPTEAERARCESRAYESGAELLARILLERRSHWNGKGKYKEASQPEIETLPSPPEGWTWSALGQLAWSVKDGPHYSPKYTEQGIPFISGGNIRPEGIDFTGTKYISPELHAELSKRCMPEHGDLLYTKGGTTGIARINTETREFNVWVHVAVLKLVDSIHHFYLQYALNSPHCYRQSQLHTHGVGNQDLGLTRMVWITVPLPPLAEQERIVAEVERRLSVIEEVEATVATNLKRAERLRQSVLSLAFNTHNGGEQ